MNASSFSARFCASLLGLALLFSPPPQSTRAQSTADALAFTAAPQFVSGSGWRLTFRSEPGRQYRIDRSVDLQNWTLDIGTVTAAGTSTLFVDPDQTTAGRRFWRAVLLPGDAQAPVIGGVDARILLVGGVPALQFRVTASDNVAVAGVLFLDGVSAPLGEGAFDAAEALWKITQPLPTDTFAVREVKARARDAANNTADSPLARFTLFDPTRFARLDGAGNPLRGAPPTVDALGNLGPFAMFAGGGGALGTGADLVLRFPNGARVVTQGTQKFLEFNQVSAAFGAESPFEIAQNPPIIQRGGSRPSPQALLTPRQLPIGALTVSDLLTALDLPATDGLPVRIFQRFETRLRAGSLLPEGWVAPQFEFDPAKFPGLPTLSAIYQGLVLDLSDPRAVRIPFHGEIPLTDGTPNPPVLRVPAENPLWLTLRAEGSVALEGRAEVSIPATGLRIRVGVRLDDPNYRLRVSADTPEVALIDQLAPRLPAPPASVNAAQLDAESARLAALQRAVRHFTAAALGGAPTPTTSAGLAAQVPFAPPTEIPVLAHLLEAWTESAASGGLGTIEPAPLLALQNFARQLALAGGAARDLRAIASDLAAVVRARQILASATLQPALDSALADLEAAAIARASEPAGTATLTDLVATLRALAEAKAAYQAIGRTFPVTLLAGLDRLVNDLLAARARSLGVTASAYAPLAGGPVAALGRLPALQQMRDLRDLLAAAQALGLQPAAGNFSVFTAPVGELVNQLAARATDLLNVAAVEAESRRDYRAVLSALEDLIDLVALRQAGFFPSAGAGALNAAGLAATLSASLVNRLDAASLADLAKPVEERAWFDRAGDLVRLTNVLADLDAAAPALTFAAGPFTRAINAMEPALGAAVNAGALAGVARPGDLVRLLAAGSLHDRLARRFGGTGVRWDNDRLPQVVARLTVLAQTQKSWSELFDAAGVLLAEAEQIRLEALRAGANQADLAVRRTRYLDQTAALVAVARTVGLAVQADVSTRRGAAGPAAFAFQLPGEVQVMDPWGALDFVRTTGALRGAIGGRLLLPGLLGTTQLDVKSLTLSNRGAFDLTASGTIDAMPLGTLTGSLEVLPRRPLRLSYRPGQPLAVAGSARLTLSNGFFFEGYIDFRDPLYKFGAATGGLRFDLANRLLVDLPPNVNFSAVPAQTAAVWAGYLQQLGASVEPLIDLAQTPLLGQPGRPPEFRDPALAFQYADLGAWVAALRVDASFATAGTVGSLLGFLREHLANASTGAAQLAGGLELQRKQQELTALNAQLRATVEALPAGGLRDQVKLDPAVRAYAQTATPRVRQVLQDPLSAASAENARVAVRLAADHDATLSALGLSPAFVGDPIYAQILEIGFGNRLTELGLSATTGQVANATTFEALSRVQIVDALGELADLKATQQLAAGGTVDARFLQASLELARRLRNLTAAALQATPTSDWQRQTELQRDLVYLAVGDQAGQLVVDATLRAQLQSDLAAAEAASPTLAAAREADEQARAANPLYEVWAQVRDQLRRLGTTPTTLDEAARTRVRREMQARLDTFAVRLPLSPTAIADLSRDLRDLAELVGSAQDLLGPDDPVSASARTKLAETSITIPGVANAQRAWWELTEYARLVNEALSRRPNLVGTAAGNALRGALDASLTSALGLINALKPQIQANRPLDIRLPGNLVVRRAFGDFLYRRTPPLFTATFGGQFEFPEINTRFTLNSASISSTGAWSLNLAASGDLNAGGDGLRYRINSFSLSGTAAGGLSSGSGAGQLLVARADQPTAPPDVYDVTLFYGQPGGTGPRVFDLTTTATGKFVFDPNFVVFNATLGLRFTTDFTGGRLSTSGTAGFFARGVFNAATCTPNDFECTIENAGLVYTYSPSGFTVDLNGGTLLLPVFQQVVGSVACSGTGPLADRPATPAPPSVTLSAPLRLAVTYAQGSTPSSVTFGTPGGQPLDVAFANLGLAIPGLPDFRLDICSATLRFPFTPGAFPILRDFNAKLELPLPNDANGQPQRVRTRIAGKNWRTNGFPEQLSVTLDQNFRVVDTPNLKLEILASVADCSSQPAGLDFFTEPGPNAGETTNAFRIRGGARIETDVVRDAGTGGSVAIGTCGTLTLRFDYNGAGVFQRVRPEIGFNQITLSGQFRLGGPEGIELTGPSGGATPATISLQNLPNFLAPSAANPFQIRLDGRVTFGAFGAFVLDNAFFNFAGPGLPTFSGRMALVAGQQLQLLQSSSALPVTITEVGLTFANNLPLDQAFRPQNLQIDLSGFADFKLPTGQGDATATGDAGPGSKIPRLFFALDHFRFSFPNGFAAPPTVSTNGLTGEIQNLSVGDFVGLTGGLSLQGLQGPAEAITIGGVVGTTIKGVGAKVALAAKMSGLVSLCLDLNLGPAGIPIDGGALGGVLLTGASGGVNFANLGAPDPCSAFARLGFGRDGRPLAAARGSALERARLAEPVGLPWGEAFARADALERTAGRSLNFDAVPMVQSPDPRVAEERRARAAALEVAALQGVTLDLPGDCPTGDCPPATLNLLCQLHPSHGQPPGAGNYNGLFAGDTIVKFTSLSSGQVDAIITAAGLDGLLGSAGVGQSTSNATIAAQFSTQVRSTVSGLIPRLPQGAPGEIDVNLAIEDALDLLRDTLRNTTRSALDLATGGLSPRDALRKAGYAGLKCQDITLKLQGTLSHAAVSTFLALDGGYTVSTRGFGSIAGALKLVGIPVGTANLSLALSNATGDFAPLLCGSVDVGLGPLEFGGLRLRFDPGLNTNAVLTALGTFVTGLAGDAAEAIYQMIDAANGPGVTANRGTPLVNFFQPSYAAGVPADSRLTPAQQQAVLAQLFNLQNLTAIAGLSPAGLATLRSRAETLAVEVTLALNPDLRFCGTIEPKLFGLGLGGGETAGVSLAYSKQPGAGGTNYDVLAGSFSISPSWLLFNYGLVLSSAGQIPPFVPGIDSAEVGFASRARSFDQAKLHQLYSGPAGAATVVQERMAEVFQNSLVTFQYALKPFGLELGNTQVRIFMPQFAAHPRRSGVSWTAPTDTAFPGTADETAAGRLRREIITRAGTLNLIKEPTWLGTPGAPDAAGRLGTLFASTGDNALIGRMNALDLGRDVFPYGGVLGSGRLALPRPLTDGLPADFYAIFDPTKTLQQRFDAFTATASFLSSTRQVGDLAFYFPAPNPPSALLNGTLDAAGLRALAVAMGSLDYAAITRGTRDASFYAFDQVFLRGALSIPVLGLPLAQGSVTLNGLNGTFELKGRAPAGGWLEQLGVTADLLFSVGAPRAALDKQAALALSTPAGQPLLAPRSQSGIDGLTDVVTRYTGLTPATLNFTQLQSELYAAMPRVQLVSNLTVNLNRPEFASFFQAGSGAAVRLFAYSPGFEPNAAVPVGIDPLNPDPQTLARRQGGAGLAGSFLFGYFPGGNANDPAAIRIALDASLAFLAPAEGTALPALTGLLDVPAFNIPGGPSFSGRMQFNTQPANGGNFLAITGAAAPFKFSAGGVDILSFAPLAPATNLGGTLRVLRNDALPGGAAASLSLNAMSAAIPLLGPGVAVVVHGGPNGSGGFLPFTFSTAPGQVWSASVALSAPGNPNAAPTFAIRDPFNGGSQSLLEFTPSGPLTGSIAGVGTGSFQLQVTVPTGFTATFYKGTAQESTVALPAGSNIQLYLDSAGRFYCDLGSLTNLNLPGLLSANARIEFGFNPDDPQPNVARTPTSLNFGTVNLADTVTQSVTISNTGTLLADLALSLTQSDPDKRDFDLGTGNFQLEPGGSRVVRVTFNPKKAGTRTATLNIASNDPDTPLLTVPLSGVGLAAPRFAVSRPSVAFGDTVLGGTSVDTITVTNTGSATMTVTSASLTGAGLTVSPTTSQSIAAGAARIYTLSYAPTALGSASGTLTFNVATLGAQNVPVTGQGTDTRWITLLDAAATGSTAQFNALRMVDANRGYAAGNSGTFLETRNGGRSWSPRRLTLQNLRAIAVERTNINNALLAQYRFEEPPGSTVYLDASGNGRHGTAVAAPSAATLSFYHGRFGSGLSFDGVDDYAELGNFALPSSFSISFWARFRSTADGQALVAKNTTSGGNQFIFGKYNGGWQVNFGGQVWSVPAVPALNTWTFFVLTAVYDSGANTTTVTLYRGLEGGSSLDSLGSNVFTGQVSTGGGKPWSLGQEWDGATTTSDHFNGFLDEVAFFDGALVSSERTALFRNNGERVVVAGAAGRVFQSYTGGDTWEQHPDLNAAGWRNQSKTVRAQEWNAAAIGSGGRLYLGGSVGAAGGRLLMVEGINAGADGTAGTADDEFDDVAVTGGVSSPFPNLRGLTNSGNFMYAAGSDGVIFAQSVQLNGASGDFAALSPNASPNALNAVASHSLFGGGIAVGSGGTILRTGASTVASGTTSALQSVVFNASVSPSYHAVGDGGAYLTSANNGANWQLVADGLSGDMKAVDVQLVPGGASSEYSVWAAGANQSIQYRPPISVAGPFLTYYPGRLDFGFVTVGESKTLEITIQNRGRTALQISALSFTGPASARYSLGSTVIDRIEPGDSATLPVRYRPTAVSAFDSAELLLTSNDATPGFRVPLEGRAAANDWKPVVLTNAGVAVAGEVVQLAFTSASRGYALVQPTGLVSTELYRTNDGGANWTRSTFGSFGGNVRLTTLAVARSSASSLDVLLAGGQVETTAGVFVKGLLLFSSTSTSSFSTPAWSDRTPLAAGDTSQPLRIASVALHRLFDASGVTNYQVAAATAGNSSTANVWYSTNTGSSWTLPVDRPSGYNGGPVALQVTSVFTPVFAGNGARIELKIGNGNWGTTPTIVSAGGTLRDIKFFANSALGADLSQGWAVGDGGAFLVWDPASSAASDWSPARDAEVFGTTNLAAVGFADLFEGWVVGESRAFFSLDQGLTWRLSYDAGSSAVFRDVHAPVSGAAFIGGSLDGKATVWRYAAPTASTSALLSAASQVDFGSFAPGAAPTKTVVLTNNSANPLALHDLSIVSEDGAPRFRLTGVPPATLAAGGSTTLTLKFDDSEERSIAAALAPEFFLRFEGAPDDTSFHDDSPNGRDTVATAGANQPTPVRSSRRDRAVRFDGVDDRLELPNVSALDVLPASFSVSLWAAPESLSGTRTLLSKDLATGGDGFKFSQTSTGYQVKIRGATATFASVPALDWTHLVVLCTSSGSNTSVSLYRDGALVGTQSIAGVAGNLAGRPWTLGAEWTSASATSAFFLGALDDVGLFFRALSDGEIAQLGARSPLYGEHRAQLVINSGSESGRRAIDLRATVAVASSTVVIRTEPEGRQVTIDGIDYTTPVAFTVSAAASGAAAEREWVEGSQHRLTTKEASFSVTAADGTQTTYTFGEWEGGGPRAFAFTASRSGPAELKAVFVPTLVTPPTVAAPPARASGPNPLLAGLANSPKGPFFRLSNGSLKLPNLGATGFAISGELLVSLTKLKGHLTTTALNLPDNGDRHVEIGASRWLLDATVGGSFTLAASPPSLRVLGVDVLPDGQAVLRYTKGVSGNPDTWGLEFTLRRDFKPWPDALEFKKGFTRVTWLASGLPGFALEFQGGVRLLRLPGGSFAFDRTMTVRFDTVNFDVGLNDFIPVGSRPTDLFNTGAFAIGWGDIRLRRTAGGPIALSLVNLPMRVHGQTVVNVNGALTTDGTLRVTGDLASGNTIRLEPSGRFFLEKSGSGTQSFELLVQALPSPRLRLATPALQLKTTATGGNGNVFGTSGIPIPGLTIDTAGTFDTGKLPLPAMDFDGITIDGDPAGKRADNHLRLQRDADGKLTFSLKSEQQFFGCRQKLSLSVVAGATLKVSGSLQGNFCLLPDPGLSLNYNSATSCQFSGSAFGFTVKFGPGCARVESGGVCLLGCP
ncbi:MAG: choice-of-anchor D domain-containing protein [Verrucomicrobia bacterium]|nr:choice-of-anchor D domain-containing protein [Verrucomicrobiota bacterium]